MSRRRNNVDGRTEVVFIRMTPEEKAQLYELAAGGSLSDFVRWLVREYYEVSNGSAQAS
jgi:hypothetical protein